MGPMSLTENDKKKTIEFVNFIAVHAKFSDMTTQDIIQYYGLLSFVQKTLIPKLEANILEVEQVIEAKPEPESVPGEVKES